MELTPEEIDMQLESATELERLNADMLAQLQAEAEARAKGIIQ